MNVDVTSVPLGLKKATPAPAMGRPVVWSVTTPVTGTSGVNAALIPVTSTPMAVLITMAEAATVLFQYSDW